MPCEDAPCCGCCPETYVSDSSEEFWEFDDESMGFDDDFDDEDDEEFDDDFFEAEEMDVDVFRMSRIDVHFG
jgi:hypothetical protein